MPSRLDDLVSRLTDIERDIEQELHTASEHWRYRLERGRIRFEHDVEQAHRKLRQGLAAFLRESSLASIVTAPVIYSLVVPVALVDLWATVYQFICFPVYGMVRVPRRNFIVIDRHHLQYLNGIEKLNCLYCSYANGVFAYVREVAGRTEQYWCPIRHASRVRGAHAYYREFVDYGDAEGYRRRLPVLRSELAAPAEEKTAEKPAAK